MLFTNKQEHFSYNAFSVASTINTSPLVLSDLKVEGNYNPRMFLFFSPHLVSVQSNKEGHGGIRRNNVFTGACRWMAAQGTFRALTDESVIPEVIEAGEIQGKQVKSMAQ